MRRLVFNLDGKGNRRANSAVEHKRFWRKFGSKIIHDHEEKSWKERMLDHKKLEIYSLYKTKLRLEKYLSTPTDYKGRVLLTSLRSGSNKLQIERGRWIGQSDFERICEQCDLNHAENEIHFVVAKSFIEKLLRFL